MQEINEPRGLADRIASFLAKDLSLALSLSYVGLIAIGMLFSYQYYSNWGIDIFQFAGFADFLLAPFRDMLVFFFVLISVAGSYYAVMLSRRMDKKYPRWSKYWNLGISSDSKNYNRLQDFNLIGGILVYLHVSSMVFSMVRERNLKKHPENHRIEIETESGQVLSFLLLGLTENYVLVLSEKDMKASALPLEGGIKTIRFAGK